MGKVRPCRYAVQNKRMLQIMRHVGVVATANAPHMVVLRWQEGKEPADGEDPLHALIRHLEPSSERGNENMPSLEEAKTMGLIEGGEDE